MKLARKIYGGLQLTRVVFTADKDNMYLPYRRNAGEEQDVVKTKIIDQGSHSRRKSGITYFSEAIVIYTKRQDGIGKAAEVVIGWRTTHRTQDGERIVEWTDTDVIAEAWAKKAD